MNYSMTYSSPIGRILLSSDGENITGLWMEGQKYYLENVKEKLAEKPDLKVFQLARKWLDSYFSGERPSISEIPLAPQGGEFRKAIWKMLCEIPYGEYTTYGELAKKMAERVGKTKMSAQAVGGAVGHNPISIIIPCHRVVGTNGSLTGYSGGLGKKIKLLELEGVNMSKLFVPNKGTAL